MPQIHSRSGSVRLKKRNPHLPIPKKLLIYRFSPIRTGLINAGLHCFLPWKLQEERNSIRSDNDF